MTDSYGTTPSELEREAEANRSRLSTTLDELRDKLTPGQVMDEVLVYAKDNGSSFVQSLGVAAKNHPIPTLLIGAGIAMFFTGIGTGASSSGKTVRTGVTRRPVYGYAGVEDSREEYYRDRIDRGAAASVRMRSPESRIAFVMPQEASPPRFGARFRRCVARLQARHRPSATSLRMRPRA